MLGDMRGSLLKGVVFGGLFMIFMFSFFQYKQVINERNRNNPHLLATVKRPETPLGKLETVRFEKISIQAPLTKEAFIQKGQQILANSSKPQKIILTNTKNFQDPKTNTNVFLGEVALIGSATYSKLLIERFYPLKEAPRLGPDAPFLILATGELGLVSNTLKYSIKVTNSKEPEQWIAYLPSFTQAVQQASELREAQSLIFIHSKTDHFIYNAKKINQLTEIIDLEME